MKLLQIEVFTLKRVVLSDGEAKTKECRGFAIQVFLEKGWDAQVGMVYEVLNNVPQKVPVKVSALRPDVSQWIY